jgi:hypothetical protein
MYVRVHICIVTTCCLLKYVRVQTHICVQIWQYIVVECATISGHLEVDGAIVVEICYNFKPFGGSLMGLKPHVIIRI